MAEKYTRTRLDARECPRVFLLCGRRRRRRLGENFERREIGAFFACPTASGRNTPVKWWTRCGKRESD